MGNRVQALLNMNQSGTATFSVSLPKKLKENLDALCSQRGLQRNQLVGAAIEDILAEAKTNKPALTAAVTVLPAPENEVAKQPFPPNDKNSEPV